MVVVSAWRMVARATGLAAGVVSIFASSAIAQGGTDLPLIADAGADHLAAVGQAIRLDGSGSQLGTATGLTYTWSAKDGASVLLSNTDSLVASARLDDPGTAEIELRIGTVDGVVSFDTVHLSSAVDAPVADAGLSRTVVAGEAARLDASARYGANGGRLVPRWTLQSAPDGSMAMLADTASFSPEFTPDLQGDYVFSLTVTDLFGQRSERAVVTLSTENTRPIAYAGPDRAAPVGTTVRIPG